MTAIELGSNGKPQLSVSGNSRAGATSARPVIASAQGSFATAAASSAISSCTTSALIVMPSRSSSARARSVSGAIACSTIGISGPPRSAQFFASPDKAAASSNVDTSGVGLSGAMIGTSASIATARVPKGASARWVSFNSALPSASSLDATPGARGRKLISASSLRLSGSRITADHSGPGAFLIDQPAPFGKGAEQARQQPRARIRRADKPDRRLWRGQIGAGGAFADHALTVDRQQAVAGLNAIQLTVKALQGAGQHNIALAGDQRDVLRKGRRLRKQKRGKDCRASGLYQHETPA